MDKEKEIEEMAIILSTEDGTTTDCQDCDHRTMCFRQCDAEKLYNAGYCKADEVRKETAKEIFDELIRVTALMELQGGHCSLDYLEVQARKWGVLK